MQAHRSTGRRRWRGAAPAAAWRSSGPRAAPAHTPPTANPGARSWARGRKVRVSVTLTMLSFPAVSTLPAGLPTRHTVCHQPGSHAHLIQMRSRGLSCEPGERKDKRPSKRGLSLTAHLTREMSLWKSTQDATHDLGQNAANDRGADSSAVWTHAASSKS